MKQTNVKVIMSFNNPDMKEILPIGFETELIPVYSTKDKTLVNEQTRHNKATGKVEVIAPAVIAPAGSFEGYTFLGANGETYDDKTLINAIGYVPLSEIFDKLHS